MGADRINRPDIDGYTRDGDNTADVLHLKLEPDEARILLKACRRYRSTIPSYLQAKQAEVDIIDSIIKILAGCRVTSVIKKVVIKGVLPIPEKLMVY